MKACGMGFPVQKQQFQMTPPILLDDALVFNEKTRLVANTHPQSTPTSSISHSSPPYQNHPGGEIKHGKAAQILRLLILIGYFGLSCAVIVTTQLIGVPLYWINRNYYYAYMASTKESFGIFVTTLTQWWAPTVVRISGDSSMAGQLRTTANGKVEFQLPERLVMVANHQLYSDWLYLWWVAYTNMPKMHGHIYIILKESLKHIPMIGWGMRFYGFIFMSRKLATDEPRLSYRLRKLNQINNGPLAGEKGLNPMWLLLFPEGTNASIEGRTKSASWAKKTGVEDLEHTLLPRSSGTYFCLNEVKDTVDYLYDCTLAYEGVKHGEFGQDNYTLHTMYLLGQTPPSVNMYWRRFPVSEIPLDDKEEFDHWLRSRWIEKDALIDQFINTGRFPPNVLNEKDLLNLSQKKQDFPDFIETEVKTAHFWEVGYIFLPLITFISVVNLLIQVWNSGVLSRVFY